MSKHIKNNKIDIVIPAYNAEKTITRTLSSILMQTIVQDIHVIIVDDFTPIKSSTLPYTDIKDNFKKLGMSIEIVRLDKNAGPGIARQVGIETGKNEFFTCIDADDTFLGALALETMRTAMKQDNPQLPEDSIKCVSATFIQVDEDFRKQLPHQNDMVWMFGKLYRRKFIEDYGIKFSNTRANEDTGYNKWVQLLCTNPNEQIKFIQDPVYYWHYKENSITRINNGQYALDQCFCGWTDNMIYAIENVRKKRPFDGNVMQTIASVMLQLYYYWIETYSKQPVFADQNWEYVKKFYHRCYKKIEDDISEEALSELFSMASMAKYQDGSMIGVVPCIGIKEFFEKLHNDSYNENDIYNIWDTMRKDENTKKLMQNNIDCGVCVYDKPEIE